MNTLGSNLIKKKKWWASPSTKTVGSVTILCEMKSYTHSLCTWADYEHSVEIHIASQVKRELFPHFIDKEDLYGCHKLYRFFSVAL